MTFGSLFAGIGGFDLGFERAGLECVWQVEIDEFCRKVLTKHWPDVPKWDDVRTFTGDGFERPDTICGGFPCQDISVAGFRAGLAGDRSGLWWEFARIVRLLRPRFVVVENVSGLLCPVDDGEQAAIGCVLGELARIGYDAEWQSIPAFVFGSTQERYRVFIIAYPQSDRSGPGRVPIFGREGLLDAEGNGQGVGRSSGVGSDAGSGNSDPHGQRREELHVPGVAATPGLVDRAPDADDAVSGRSERGQGATEEADESGQRRASSEPDQRDSTFVGQGWWGTEPALERMVYGVPRGLVRPAIRGLGNSVIPQVAEFIGKQLLESINAR